MNTNQQTPDLFEHARRIAALPALPKIEKGSENVKFVIHLLEGKDWKTARELCELLGWPITEDNKRWFRAVAQASEGQIAGDQRGYKLVREMTKAEYDAWEARWTKEAREIETRVVEARRVFYRPRVALNV